MVAPKKKSRWSILKAEATKDYTPKPPYLFDAVEPPIEIQAPDTIEQTLALAALLDSSGSIDQKDFKSFLATVCGDAFPKVWAVLRKEPDVVLIPFVEDINDHFQSVPVADAEVDEVPGKESA